MVSHLHSLLEKHDLMHRMIAFMKDEGNNLMYIATTLRSIDEGTCFGHIMF